MTAWTSTQDEVNDLVQRAINQLTRRRRILPRGLSGHLKEEALGLSLEECEALAARGLGRIVAGANTARRAAYRGLLKSESSFLSRPAEAAIGESSTFAGRDGHVL